MTAQERQKARELANKLNNTGTSDTTDLARYLIDALNDLEGKPQEYTSLVKFS